MINHARTLLLNIPANRTQMQDLGYEYIPATYRPVALSPSLAALRRALFGSNPDNYFLNVRARELLGYIHETELAQYVTTLDSRTTYWPPGRSDFFENAKARVNIVQTAGQPLRLNFGGTFSANTATGTSTQAYDVALNNEDGNLAVVTQQTTKPAAATTTTIQSTATSPSIALADTRLQFAVNFAATSIEDVTTAALLTETTDLLITEEYIVNGMPVGFEIEPQEILSLQMRGRPRLASTFPTGEGIARWRITVRANPAPVVANISTLELLGEPLFLELFGVADVEPYATFKNLWFDHPLPPYRLGGLVLALIYRTNELAKTYDG